MVLSGTPACIDLSVVLRPHTLEGSGQSVMVRTGTGIKPLCDLGCSSPGPVQRNQRQTGPLFAPRIASRSALQGGAVLSLGSVLSLCLLTGVADISRALNTTEIANVFSNKKAGGLASYGRIYHPEFNFIGRLTTHVANPMDKARLRVWTAAHPTGIVPSQTALLNLPCPHHETIFFRKTPYAIWHVSDAPQTWLETAA